MVSTFRVLLIFNQQFQYLMLLWTGKASTQTVVKQLKFTVAKATRQPGNALVVLHHLRAEGMNEWMNERD